MALRPELYWDRNGRITGSEQFITAATSTLEYTLSLSTHTILARLEHRYDKSQGSGGGFFRGDLASSGTVTLTPGQHLVFCSLLWYFDY